MKRMRDSYGNIRYIFLIITKRLNKRLLLNTKLLALSTKEGKMHKLIYIFKTPNLLHSVYIQFMMGIALNELNYFPFH